MNIERSIAKKIVKQTGLRLKDDIENVIKMIESFSKISNCPKDSTDGGFYTCRDSELVTKYGSKVNVRGLDLPIWYSKPKQDNKKKLMIIAQDPKRTSKDFPKADDRLVIGTPFAFHNSSYSNRTNTKLFHSIVSLLSKENHVYVTDAKKLYGYKGNLNDFNSDILKAEIKKVAPDYIIVFGDTASEAISEIISNKESIKGAKEDSKIKFPSKNVIKLPHPSGSNNGKWAQIGDATQDAKLNYCLKKIKSKVK